MIQNLIISIVGLICWPIWLILFDWSLHHSMCSITIVIHSFCHECLRSGHSWLERHLGKLSESKQQDMSFDVCFGCTVEISLECEGLVKHWDQNLTSSDSRLDLRWEILVIKKVREWLWERDFSFRTFQRVQEWLGVKDVLQRQTHFRRMCWSRGEYVC